MRGEFKRGDIVTYGETAYGKPATFVVVAVREGEVQIGKYWIKDTIFRKLKGEATK